MNPSSSTLPAQSSSSTPPPFNMPKLSSAHSTYPSKTCVSFTPGGLDYKNPKWVCLADFSRMESASSAAKSPSKPRPPGLSQPPDALIQRAKQADDVVRQYSILYGRSTEVPHYLPSLAALASAAFGPLTGVPPASVKRWADAMVLHYMDVGEETIPTTEAEIWERKPPPPKIVTETTVSVLKSILEQQQQNQPAEGDGVGEQRRRRRPCGYVFARGDIAWNCRTCQTDPTCVICDNCFRNSNHDGHEVYFHRTTPGGCCDCGDAEAWKLGGCCPVHRPDQDETPSNSEDEQEAVLMALRGLQEGCDTLQEAPTSLPPRLTAALGVVIGAAVGALVKAMDGAAMGADPIQWKLKWIEEACRVWNGTPTHVEEYYIREINPEQEAPMTPTIMLRDQTFPPNYLLHLRLHNDDVHTFDEVIDALHDTRHVRARNAEQSAVVAAEPPLVTRQDDASEMTHCVDAEGQVTVKTYTSTTLAMQGYRRLKSKGLHCAIVGTSVMEMELRAKALTAWLTDLTAVHPAAAVLVVHALVSVTHDDSSTLLAGSVPTWREPRMMPTWASLVAGEDEITSCRRRFYAFPPHMASSYLTRDEAEVLYRAGMQMNPTYFMELTGTDPSFYANIPYRLPSEKYRKSPHALWGTLPSTYADTLPLEQKHALLYRMATGKADETAATMKTQLIEEVYVVDTDLRKQEESERILASVYSHRLPGVYLLSGVGTVKVEETTTRAFYEPPNTMECRHLFGLSSFRAPISPVVMMLLLDPYPTKQVRTALHSLFLSLLVDARFKCRFAAALGAVAYRPLSTLFCAGVGTESDTPLGFTVQIFTAGSLVRGLGSSSAIEKLLRSDMDNGAPPGPSIGVFAMPIAHSIVRCIHTNLLGASKEVRMLLKNTVTRNDEESSEDLALRLQNNSLLPALTYNAGEHPMCVLLPAAPDDGFLDSRSTRHKRLPHLLRDLEYVMETPGTALRLMLPLAYPYFPRAGGSTPATPLLENLLPFATVYARMLRMAQGMDPQKRKISGGHVEYEQSRWLDAFGLSLNFAGTRDALSESLTNSSSATLAPVAEDGSHVRKIQEAMGHMFMALLRELKVWLYREGALETGLPNQDPSQVEALQRSTLHVSSSQLGAMAATLPESPTSGGGVNSVALACEKGVKMTEAQLELIEGALRLEEAQRHSGEKEGSTSGPAMGDWLRIPHSPLGGDSLSFHLPLHRALAKCIRSMCYVVIPQTLRERNSRGWWKLPVLDVDSKDATTGRPEHPIVALMRTSMRSSNCRVVWTSGPDCTSAEAQQRRARVKNVSANIAAAKLVHSLADHPLRCLAAAQQIERHLWARNGSSTAGMALNYSSSPLCRSFRDLDVTLVQLSAAGMGAGLGARRVFSLLISRFSMDGYLCDPERKIQSGSRTSSPTTTSSPTSYGAGNAWVNPPRLLDPDHAVALSESFFSSMCVVVTELPPPPPLRLNDDSALRSGLRRELIHALAVEPRSHSEAMEAATSAGSRRDESAGISGGGSGVTGGALGDVFTAVLREVGKQKSQARSASGPSAYELLPECSDEYDPTFFHLRRQDHQHAMDTIERLRRQKAGKGQADSICYPIVCTPPRAHPRFLACRLLLHLPAMDAAIRRELLFAVTGGSWLPPSEPSPPLPEQKEQGISAKEEVETTTISTADGASVQVTTFGRRTLQRASSSNVSRRSSDAEAAPFSSATVASSSVSTLEILQLLTLQVHTLEECASLHRLQPDLDEETKNLSFGLSIDSYLRRLIHVPDSLLDAWAFKPYPDGPLPSKGTGENRASILGLLIALYEHRSARVGEDDGGDSRHGDEGQGGARALSDSGLKWLLRFVQALVDGAASVGAAVKSATSGVPVRIAAESKADAEGVSWTIEAGMRSRIVGMLHDLPDLWPKKDAASQSEDGEKASAKNKEAGKAAQQRIMEMMKRKQKAFELTIAPTSDGGKMDVDEENEEDLCIICRCDDTDGENNGPLGYLGHVQRSRYSQMRCTAEIEKEDMLFSAYRVSGHRGCQLRKTEAMDSEPLVCLPTGSVVSVLNSTVSENYDILSRRVYVRHAEMEKGTGKEVTTEGWASVQSSEGYVILSPLATLCSSSSRWGSTRPIIRQCGHAAHLECVETHTLSLHQRAAGEQPYDGRFAANIDDGEFLCPLCKQLSNVLLPRDGCAFSTEANDEPLNKSSGSEWAQIRIKLGERPTEKSPFFSQKALSQYGDQLLQAMTVPWDRHASIRKRKTRKWQPELKRWDYEEQLDRGRIGDMLSMLRQMHIAWASLGHSAAASEASTRGIEEVLPFGVFAQTSDPWVDYGTENRDTHPMLLELRRTLAATTGLYDIFVKELVDRLNASDEKLSSDEKCLVGLCLCDILEGISPFAPSTLGAEINGQNRLNFGNWFQLAALLSATPVHSASDMLSIRHDARAVASAMWLIQCVGPPLPIDEDDDDVPPTPPTPLAVKQVQKTVQPVTAEFGSLRAIDVPDGSVPPKPFLPGLACGYLYIPLLCWDLSTFAGAIFCSMLANSANGAQLVPSQLLFCARVLLLGRLVQCIVSPSGYLILEDDEEYEPLEHWTTPEFAKESDALVRLVQMCRSRLGLEVTEVDPQKLFSAVGRSILPFGRTLVLLLRASASLLKQRGRKKSTEERRDAEVERIEEMLVDEELMTIVDGFALMKRIGGDVPSGLVQPNASTLWSDVIERWLSAAEALEKHHGSQGRTLLTSSPDSATQAEESSLAALKVEQSDSSELSNSGDAAMSRSGGDGDESGDETMNSNVVVGDFQGPDDEEDDEMIEAMELDVEEVVVVDDPVVVEVTASRSASAADDSSDEDEEEENDDDDHNEDPSTQLQEKFENVSKAAMIPHQASFLGQAPIGPGARGSSFEHEAAMGIMRDVSHMGMIHRQLAPTKCLIRLPKSFVELYSLVNKVKGRTGSGADGAIGAADDGGSSETAICLLTGAVMRSGSPRRSSYSRATRPPGTCTMHARSTGSGIGIFFLLQKCTTLLMHNNKSAYSASLYVDQHGEEDPGLKRGRPLFLNEARVRALEQLWRQQGIPREVAQIRSTSDRVIRDDWY